jgi:hypothetical protein
VVEPGEDLYDWETRWAELQDEIAEDPERALPDAVDLVERMVREAGYDLDEPVTAEGEDLDVVRNLLAARQVAAAAERGDVEPEDITTTLDDLQELYEYLIEGRGTC